MINPRYNLDELERIAYTEGWTLPDGTLLASVLRGECRPARFTGSFTGPPDKESEAFIPEQYGKDIRTIRNELSRAIAFYENKLNNVIDELTKLYKENGVTDLNIESLIAEVISKSAKYNYTKGDLPTRWSNRNSSGSGSSSSQTNLTP